MSDYYPELSAPDDEPSPRVRRKRRALRIIALITMIVLVVPGVIGTVIQTHRNGIYACELAVNQVAPTAQSSQIRFEWLPVATAGWHCYATFYDGSIIHIRALGPIPSLPTSRPSTTS